MESSTKPKQVRLSTTPSPGDLAKLSLGDIVYLDGVIYTAREGVYIRAIEQGVPLPLKLPQESATNFHCSPAASIGEDAHFSASSFLRYVGRSTLGIGPVLGRPQGDYVDTGLELRLERGRRALTLSGTNLLDTRGNRFALGTPLLIRDENQITPLRPRTVRLGIEIGF